MIVYSKGDFEDNGKSWSSPGDAAQWLTEVDPESGELINSKIVFFSQYSGAGIR